MYCYINNQTHYVQHQKSDFKGILVVPDHHKQSPILVIPLLTVLYMAQSTWKAGRGTQIILEDSTRAIVGFFTIAYITIYIKKLQK